MTTIKVNFLFLTALSTLLVACSGSMHENSSLAVDEFVFMKGLVLSMHKGMAEGKKSVEECLGGCNLIVSPHSDRIIHVNPDFDDWQRSGQDCLGVYVLFDGRYNGLYTKYIGVMVSGEIFNFDATPSF